MAGVTNIGQDLTAKFWSGQKTVGVSPSAVIGQALIYSKGIQLKADKNNAGVIYISKSPGVTTANGFALYPGDGVFIPIENSSFLYAVSDTADQKLYWLAA